MKRSVFYAWQSDLPNSTNRGFIQKALEDAARDITVDDSVEIEPVIDRDTQGVPGSPDIARTIFEKIAAADVVVADVSIINGQQADRPTPNPNVIIELGYAFHALGQERVIMVFNDAYGNLEQLPFDLKMRRATRYTMPETKTDRSVERKALQSKLEGALKASLASSDSVSVPTVAHSESLPLLQKPKPSIEMIGFQYFWLKTDENYIWRSTWRDSGEGRKALLFTFLNNPDPDGKGIDAFFVRGQVRFEWDTQYPGPNFSPVPWLDEEFSFVDIPLGVEKKLIIGTGAGPERGWLGYKNNRTNATWTKTVNPLESDGIPDRGKMKVRLIASIGGGSEVIWMACFDWRIDYYPNHPWFHQIDCKDLKAV